MVRTRQLFLRARREDEYFNFTFAYIPGCKLNKAEYDRITKDYKIFKKNGYINQPEQHHSLFLSMDFAKEFAQEITRYPAVMYNKKTKEWFYSQYTPLFEGTVPTPKEMPMEEVREDKDMTWNAKYHEIVSKTFKEKYKKDKQTWNI